MTAADIPATAVAVLRERADATERVSAHAAYAPVQPAFLRAVADLMDACLLTNGGTWCLMCDSILPHSYKCPLAALERLIAGSPARIEGERDADR